MILSSAIHLVIAHYHVQPGRVDEVLVLLSELAEASRTEPDNLGYEYFVNAQDTHEVLIVERYRSANGFAAHRESDHFQRVGLGRIIPMLESREVEEFPNS